MLINEKINIGLISTIITIILSLLIPSSPIAQGFIIEYKYGFPISFLSIYQSEIKSKWMYFNVFNGNMGISMNLLAFIMNIIIIYLVIIYGLKIFNKAKNNFIKDVNGS